MPAARRCATLAAPTTPHFHHLYRARDRRVFTTDDVTFVKTDIHLPDYSGNVEIELLGGLPRLTEDEQRLVDSHAGPAPA
jgi:hypothetical protein